MCGECLARQPEDRPDAATVARTLTEALTSTPSPATGHTAPVPTVPVGRVPATVGVVTAPMAAVTPLRRHGRFGSALAVVVLGGVLIGLWPGLRSNLAGAQASASGTVGRSMVGASPAGCRVQYELQRNADGQFASAVTVRNTGAEDVIGWQLEFTFPGHQRLVEATATDDAADADWNQSGQTVVIRGAMLASGAAVTTDVRGEYDGTYAFPVQFRLNDTACQPTLVAASQAPTASTGGGEDDHRGKGKKDDGEGAGASLD